MMTRDELIRREREEAWIGDAVLALYARRWILENEGRMDSAIFADMTSNQFLNTMGQPTAMEAKIGRAFTAGGLQAAEDLITAELLPLFLKQRHNRSRRQAK